jgi:S1-C subfamily serine protease
MFLLNGSPTRLGVALDEVTPEKAQELKLPAEAGAIVTSIEEGSPADQAGLQKRDVIVEFDGTPVRSSAELRRLIRETPAGRHVAIKVIRNGQAQVLHAKLEASGDLHFNMPDVHIPEFQFPFHSSGATLGISGDDLTTQLAKYFGVKQGKGVLVREVLVGSAAEKAGLKAGDVIVQVEGKTVGGVDDLRAELEDHSETRKVKLTIVRDHHEQAVNVELAPASSGEQNSTGAALLGLDREKLAEIQQQAQAIAEQVRRQVQVQRDAIQGEWQRQLQEQMRKLREQLKNQPALGVKDTASVII